MIFLLKVISKPFQKYTVSISGDLRDEFDQKLGKDMSYSWTMGAKERQLRQGQQFLTIAPGQKPELSFYAQAVDNVHVKNLSSQSFAPQSV